MSSRLAEILEEVRTLPPKEQRQLREQLDTIVSAPTLDELEDAFERELVAEGIISIPENEDEDDDDWEPVEVTGKPISEMIIEERR